MLARRIIRVIMALLVASPAVGQTHKVAVSFLGGGATHTDMASDAATEIRMADGWVGGVQIERWFGQVGLRLSGGMTERTLVVDPTAHMNLYTGDLDLMIRFRRPAPRKWFMPYLAIGAGASTYNLAGESSVVVGEQYGPDPVFRPMAVGALGFDIGAGPVVLRVEGFDQVDIMSPLERADGSFYGPVNRLGASAGFSFRLGGGLPRPRRLAEEPAPEPAEEVAPEPTVVADAPAPAPEPAEPTPDPTLVEALSTIESLSARVAAMESLKTRVAELERTVDSLEARPVVMAAAADAAPAPARPLRARGPLYTVQIASFLAGHQERAERVVREMKGSGLPIWIARAEVHGRIVHRVRIGALESEEDAHALGMYINRTYSWPFWVARVEEAEPVPADAVAATQAFLNSANN